MARPYPYDVIPSKASLRGLDRVRIGIDNWGTTDLSVPYAQSLTVDETSFAGIMIAPDSDIGSCRVTPSEYAGGLLQIATTAFVVAVGAPYIGEIPSPLMIWRDDPYYWNDVYVPSGETATAPFGLAMAAKVFCEPRLSLYAFLRTPPPPDSRRAPKKFQVSDWPISDEDTPEVIRVVPVGGRSRARISVKASGGDIAVTLGASFGGINQDNREFPISEWANVIDGGEKVFEIPLDAVWLFVKALKVNGTPEVSVDMMLYDP